MFLVSLIFLIAVAFDPFISDNKKNHKADPNESNLHGFCKHLHGLAQQYHLLYIHSTSIIDFLQRKKYCSISPYTPRRNKQLAESTDNKLAIEVLTDIADEEKVHAGEFLRLLKELAPDEEKFYSEGAQEVEEEIEAMKTK